jgi:hypothetical protein
VGGYLANMLEDLHGLGRRRYVGGFSLGITYGGFERMRGGGVKSQQEGLLVLGPFPPKVQRSVKLTRYIAFIWRCAVSWGLVEDQLSHCSLAQ